MIAQAVERLAKGGCSTQVVRQQERVGAEMVDISKVFIAFAGGDAKTVNVVMQGSSSGDVDHVFLLSDTKTMCTRLIS